MNTDSQLISPEDGEPVGPPVKFDAEPVRRKSKRWIFVLIGLFFGIAGAVGLGVWQVKIYLQKNAQEREANQKKGSEEVVQQRSKRTFDLEASLPEDFPQPTAAPEPAPITVINTGGSSPSAQIRAAEINTGSAVQAPLRRSMMIETEPRQADTGSSAEEEALSIAKRLASANVMDGQTAAPSVLNAGGGSQPRAKSVQEFAKRAPSPVTKTPQALATMLGDRDYLLAKSAAIPCTLQTQLNSNVAGPVKCVVSQNIYSDNGKIMLIERGSTIDGEYKSTLKPGDARISVIWSRIKTPNGIVIDVDSPAADSVGSVGIAGDIDNHWMKRIGAAFLLSLVDDAVQLQTAKSGAQSAGANGSAQPYTATTSTTKRIAERVLDSTINIPPTLSRNRGERLMVLVNRDLWFDSVYHVMKR